MSVAYSAGQMLFIVGSRHQGRPGAFRIKGPACICLRFVATASHCPFSNSIHFEVLTGQFLEPASTGQEFVFFEKVRLACPRLSVTIGGFVAETSSCLSLGSIYLIGLLMSKKHWEKPVASD